MYNNGLSKSSIICMNKSTFKATPDSSLIAKSRCRIPKAPTGSLCSISYKGLHYTTVSMYSKTNRHHGR